MRRAPRRERLPRVQRVAAYAVILRDDKILLSRLADALTAKPTWTLPGGGLDHGEDPRAAVVREVMEETGLAVTVGEAAWVLSAHRANTWRRGRNVDAHALRIVYDGWVAVDAPAPRTLEVGGSTAEAAWLPISSVLSGAVSTLPLVREALRQHRTATVQRVAAYGLLTRAVPAPSGGRVEVLLTRIAPHALSGGMWHLPGGGLEFGESPREGLEREFAEETGLKIEVGSPLEIRDVHFTGVAPNGRLEDFHGIHLVFRTAQIGDEEPTVVEVGGTTDAVRWVPLAEVRDLETTAVVRAALTAAGY